MLEWTAWSAHLFPFLSPLHLPAERDQLSLSLENQFAHADQVLSDFGETLFAFVTEESRPVDQALVDLLQSLLVVPTELHLLPHPGRESCSLDHLHVEETLTFLLPDRGVLTVGQRTGRAVAQPCDVVFISTEVLTLGPGQKEEIRCYLCS